MILVGCFPFTYLFHDVMSHNFPETNFHQLSKHTTAEEAYQLGLVDAIVAPEELLSTARRWALDVCESKRPWVRALSKTDKIESLEECREILKFARDQVRKRYPNLKHPLICIDVIEEGVIKGPRAGLLKVLLI